MSGRVRLLRKLGFTGLPRLVMTPRYELPGGGEKGARGSGNSLVTWKPKRPKTSGAAGVTPGSPDRWARSITSTYSRRVQASRVYGEIHIPTSVGPGRVWWPCTKKNNATKGSLVWGGFSTERRFRAQPTTEFGDFCYARHRHQEPHQRDNLLTPRLPGHCTPYPTVNSDRSIYKSVKMAHPGTQM